LRRTDHLLLPEGRHNVDILVSLLLIPEFFQQKRKVGQNLQLVSFAAFLKWTQQVLKIFCGQQAGAAAQKTENALGFSVWRSMYLALRSAPRLVLATF